VIDQAIGVIIGLPRCDPEAAFDVLRAVSPNRNIPLRSVAADVLARTIDPRGRHRPPRPDGRHRLHQTLDWTSTSPRHLRVGRGPPAGAALAVGSGNSSRLSVGRGRGGVVTGTGNLSITWRG
jgi:hypothetical protein